MSNNNHFSNFDSFNNYFNQINFPLLNIVSVNIRSISAIDKFNKFKLMISNFSKLPSIIAVQETWFCSNLVQIYNIPGYNVVHCCRADSYGGTSVYIRNCFNYSIELCKSENFIETITVTLENIKIRGKPLKVTSFYRSQKCVFAKFSGFIENLVTNYGRCPSIIVGDSNVDFLNSPLSANLLEIISSFNYRNCHNLITRPKSGTSIDNVFSNITETVITDTIECLLTDHNLISCKVESQSNSSEYVETVRKICNYDKVRENLNNFLQVFQESDSICTDLSQIIAYMGNSAQNATENKNGKRFFKNELVPWINKNLQALIIYRDKLLKIRRKRKSVNTEIRLKRISYVIKKSCRELMNNYYYNHLEKIQQDPKKCWKFLNQNLGRKTKSQINVKDSNDILVVDNQLKSNLFNQYFLEIPKTLKDQISYSPADSCNALRTLTRCQTTFSFSHTTSSEIKHMISNLDLTKSSGWDEISPRMLFECKNLISPFLSRIFNRIISRRS